MNETHSYAQPFSIESGTDADWAKTLQVERYAEALLIKVQALEILVTVPGIPLDYALKVCGLPVIAEVE